MESISNAVFAALFAVLGVVLGVGAVMSYLRSRRLREDSLLYRLEHGEPVPTTPEEWAATFEVGEAWQLRTQVGDVMVSTAFLGVDHNFSGEGRPILWETMVFGGRLCGEMCRYCTRAEAEEGHAVMVRRVEAAEGEAEPKEM